MTAIQLAFNYDALEVETRIAVRERTVQVRDEIRRLASLIRQTAETVWALGEKLADVQARLAPSGQFAAWCEAELPGVSRGMIYNAINVYRAFPDLPTVGSEGEIGMKALYLLAAPSTPPEARAEVLAVARRGQPVRYETAKTVVEQHKPAPTPPAIPVPPSDLREWRIFRAEDNKVLWAQHPIGVKIPSTTGDTAQFWEACRQQQQAVTWLAQRNWIVTLDVSAALWRGIHPTYASVQAPSLPELVRDAVAAPLKGAPAHKEEEQGDVESSDEGEEGELTPYEEQILAAHPKPTAVEVIAVAPATLPPRLEIGSAPAADRTAFLTLAVLEAATRIARERYGHDIAVQQPAPVARAAQDLIDSAAVKAAVSLLGLVLG